MNEPRTMEVPGELLAGAGKALFGDEWQSPLARRLRIELRTVQRWAKAAREGSTYRVSRGLYEQLLGALERDAFRIQQAFDQLRAFYDAQG